jgi:flagellar protein FlaJ
MLKYIYELIFVAIGISTILTSTFYLNTIFPELVALVNLVGGLIAVIPPALIFFSKLRVRRQIEEQFLFFINDLTSSINSGMTLPLALKHCSKNDYRSLTPHINNLAAQVEWGIPFKKSLMIFAKKTKSIPIKRAIDTIVQTYKVGGKIGDTLNAIGESLMVIEKIKKERSSSVHSQILTSYLIYFVFIMILVILQMFLLPALVPRASATLPEVATTPLQEVYVQSFVNFIIIQGFFAGLVTGKMAEGSVTAGFKHSFLLIVIGYTLFTLAGQIEIRII